MKHKLLTIVIVGLMAVGFGAVPSAPVFADIVDVGLDQLPDDIAPIVNRALSDISPYLPDDYDIGSVLGDRINDYKLTYEPWRSKAAVHAVAYDEDTGFLALGGGYLFDNEVHIFRLNVESGQFDKVWDTGDGVLRSDVMSLDFGDTDLNSFIEIVVGSSDGHVYVFEQRHIYDPFANTENMFDHVWTSPGMRKVMAVKVDDVDRDFRPDIVAGAWDGTVRCFEYDDHSGYPFAEEHWITYREVWNSGDEIEGKIYTLETGDTNGNGLPEIVVGTREGRVYVFENGGLTIWIDGHPFPLVRDNYYYLNWSSANYTWTPIVSMDVGELDGSLGDELAIVAQGQGLFTLDWNSLRQTFDYRKVIRDFEPWETFGLWGLDKWVDRVVWAKNVTYHDPVNSSLIVPEPIQYTWSEALLKFLPDANVYPYNTGMASYTDGNYSTFDTTVPSVDNATAVVDFGLDEEGTGSASSDYDLIVTFYEMLDSSIRTKFNFSISQDGSTFEQVSSTKYTYLFNKLFIDVDDALSRRKWDWFRYAKLTVYDGADYSVNSIELRYIYNLITDALSVCIAPLRLDGDAYLTHSREPNRILVGAVNGEFISVGWNEGQNRYEILWESGPDDFYNLGTNIWDIEFISEVAKVGPSFPIWRILEPPYPDLPFLPLTMSDPGFSYNSWTYAQLQPFMSGLGQYIVGTKGGGGIYFNYPTGSEVTDVDFAAMVAPINPTLAIGGPWDVSAEAPWFANFDGTFHNEISGYPFIVCGMLKPELDPFEVTDPEERGKVLFFYRSVVSPYPYENYFSLGFVDTTGELVQLVGVAQTTPRMDFEDVDGDKDLDMILSTGEVYLAKNTFSELGVTNFTLVRGYFDEVNEYETSYIWGQPDLVDVDEDGDFDLIMNYADKDGATCFINRGSNNDPTWEQEKRIFSNPGLTTNLKYLGYKDVRLVPNTDEYTLGYYDDFFDIEVKGNFTLTGINPDTWKMVLAEPLYDAIDSYLVATYPEALRIDFSLMNSTAFKNAGFHIHEAWSNEDDLEEWTLSIASGDIDNDGKGEMIVGDYDSNVYVFEHMTNNTYKRMFRSFDLNHTEKSSVSPYLYEELEGISGDFNRRIWDHANHLIADVDLDQDGLKELIVAADLQIYVFEELGLTGGDALGFAYSIDIRDSVFNLTAEWDHVTEVTAIAAGDDIDYDGRLEVAVAAGPFLFIYNVPQDSWDGTQDNDFFMTSPALDGRYMLLGNALADPSGVLDYQYACIDAIVMCDTDQDGYREIIIGGTLDTRYSRPHGFVNTYECKGGTFTWSWTAPWELIFWNPVSCLTLDDQDYDGAQEIIIGHSHGFDMWEWIPGTDSQYKKVEFVTASPNYPLVQLDTVRSAGEDINVNDWQYCSDLTEGKSTLSDKVFLAYVNQSHLYWKNYTISTGIWGDAVQIFDDADYDPGGSMIITEEVQPCVTSDSDGDIYLTWKAFDSMGGTYDFYISRFDAFTKTWTQPTKIRTNADVTRNFPKVWVYNSSHVGVIYTKTDVKRVYRNFIHKGTPTAPPVWYGNFYPNWNELDAQSASVVKLPSGDHALALSAINTLTAKPDYDIWVLVADSELNFTGSIAHQATTSFKDEIFPDINYQRSDDESLIVIYETPGVLFEDQIGMVGSRDKGATWSVQETLNTIPNYIQRTEDPDTNLVNFTYQATGDLIYGPTAKSPCVLGLTDAGFMYVEMFSHYWTGFKGQDLLYRFNTDLVYGINPSSDWTGNTLRNVVDLDTGDTDNDGRKEVMVAFEQQVGVYEMKHSIGVDDMAVYEEVWLSKVYDNEVTGVTVYDSNGNVFPEIGISTGRGEVYIMEYLDTSEGATELRVSEMLWDFATPGIGSLPATHGLLQVYDVDSDTYDEIIVAETDVGEVYCLNDDGATLVWNNTDEGVGFNFMLLEDITNDSIPEVLLTSQNSTIYALNITNGLELWRYNIASGEYLGMDVADVNADGSVEIVFGTTTGEIWMVSHQGQYMNDTSVSVDAAYRLVVGNFTGDSTLLVAVVTGQSRIQLVNPVNGTVLWETADWVTDYEMDLLTSDMNEDGFVDLIYATNLGGGRFGLSLLDFTTRTTYYNTTERGLMSQLFLGDFDGDSVDEVLVHSIDKGLFLEEPSTGRSQWNYRPSAENIGVLAIDVGYLGGSGTLDIAVAISNPFTPLGIVGAVDGKNGVLMWFNVTNGLPWSATIARLPGIDSAAIIAWDFINRTLQAFEGEERILPLTPPAYTAHQAYWEKETSPAAVTGMWVKDILGDARDEIVLATSTHNLLLINGTTSAALWNLSIGESITEVRFGQLDDNPDLEIGVLLDKSSVAIFNAGTGTKIGTITPTVGVGILDFHIADFVPDAIHIHHEIAVLFEGSSSAWVGWFDRSGNSLYWSLANATSTGNHMALGRFSGSPTLYDVVIGGKDNTLTVLKGNGDPGWSIGTGANIGDIKTGDFDGDGVTDIAVRTYGNLTTILSPTTSVYYSVVLPDENIRDFYSADLYLSDGIDELVINYVDAGIVAVRYKATYPYYEGAWTYLAPLRGPYTSCMCTFDDMDGDGADDLIMTNNEYINVVSGATRRLIWHYSSQERLRSPKIGRFYSVASPPDVAIHSKWRYLVVSGSEIAPSVPPVGSSMEPAGSQVEAIIRAALVATPLIALTVLIPVYVRRRRDVFLKRSSSPD